MANNYAKALLDELMGRERDLAPSDKQSNHAHWNDSGVCRHFLINFCPHDLFTNTKSDIGPCGLLHDDFIKKEFHAKASQKEKMMFEDEFIRFCQSQLNEVERRIKRAKQRLEMSQAEKNSGANAGNAILSEENQEKIKVLTERIETLLEQIEQLGCEGKVEEAQGIMKLVDKLKEEKSAIKRDSMPMNHWIQQKAEIGAAQEKQMEVCDVCGAFLIVNDVQQRVDDHLMGKQHMGYGRLKTSLDEILERRRQERERERRAGADRERSSFERERDRDRSDSRRAPEIKTSQSRERDKNDKRKSDSNRDRDADRSRDDRRHSSNSLRSTERTRDRSNERHADRSVRHYKHRGSRRSRSRSRDRDRRRDRSKERKRSKGSSSPKANDS